MQYNHPPLFGLWSCPSCRGLFHICCLICPYCPPHTGPHNEHALAYIKWAMDERLFG